jgi:hypothetical protein
MSEDPVEKRTSRGSCTYSSTRSIKGGESVERQEMWPTAQQDVADDTPAEKAEPDAHDEEDEHIEPQEHQYRGDAGHAARRYVESVAVVDVAPPVLLLPDMLYV